MKLFTSVFDDAKLLPHFLEHYARVGVGEFYIMAPPELTSDIAPVSQPYHVTVSTIESRPMSESFIRGNLATNAVGKLRERYQGEVEWAVIVDLDEFVDFGEGIGPLIARAESEGANVVKGVMYDRFSADGRTADPVDGSSLDESYPVRSRFIADVMLGSDDKAVIVKGRLLGVPGAEHHQLVGERACSVVLPIEHFKWTAGSVDRLRQRCRRLRELGTDWWIEYARAIEHYETYGRFAWEEFGGELVPWGDGLVRDDGKALSRTAWAEDESSLPEWEFVPEGWERARREPGTVRGWNADRVARSYGDRWSEFLKAVDGSGPLGIDHEVPLGTPIGREEPLAQNIVLAWAYALARAAGGARALSVLDWGGALGHYHVLARKLFPNLQLDYHCRELAAVCEEGRRVNPDVTFHDDDTCLSRRFDLVLASNSLQYEEDWRVRLQALAEAANRWLFVTRVPLAHSEPSFVVLQRAYQYGYGTEYVGWVLNRDEVLQAAQACGLTLVREFSLLGPHVIQGAPEAAADGGFLFARAAERA